MTESRALKMAAIGAVLVAGALWLAPPQALVGMFTETAPPAGGVAPVPQQDKRSAPEGTVPVNPLAGLTAAAFSGVADRPLFNPTRAGPPKVVAPPPPPPPEEPPPPAEEPVTAADFTLVAVAGPEGARAAIVRWNKTGELFHLKQGGAVSDWTLSKLDAREATLERNGNVLIIKLFAAPQEPPPAPEAAPPSGGEESPSSN